MYSPAVILEHPSDRRLIGFLVLSALLHLAWLAVPLSVRTPPSNLTAPLVAHLAPRHESATEIVNALPGQNSALARRHLAPDPLHSLALPAHESVVTTPDPAPAPPPTINLDSARATARAYAREAQARNTLDAPKPQLTVEAAIARATEPDSVVEMRGPAGEHITQTRDLHCVTPLVVPHYMTGMTVPSQCTKRKT